MVKEKMDFKQWESESFIKIRHWTYSFLKKIKKMVKEMVKEKSRRIKEGQENGQGYGQGKGQGESRKKITFNQ